VRHAVIRRMLWAIALAPVMCALLTSTLAAAWSEEDFIAGLNERRLFSLAEAHCRRLLERQNLDAQQRVDLTIALCRTYAEHALHTPRSERGALWSNAEQAVADFRRIAGDDPRRVLVEMQWALTILARGELARQEAEIGAPGAPSLDEARRELQTAVEQLREVGEETERLLRTVGRNRGASGGALTEAELISLQRNIAYQQARALRNQALCYPPKSAERSDALIRALELLEPLANSQTADSLVWNARIDEVTCLRLRGRLAEAAARLDKLEAARPPSKTQLLARAERVRIYLDAGRPDDALEILKAGREIGGRTSAQFDLAHVQTYIALWQKAAESDAQQQAQQWQQRAAAMVQAMEEMYGPYWTRRGEMLLAASAGGSASSANLDVLVRAAKNHYLRKEYDEAVGAYDRAAAAALEAGDRSRAFDLYHAALLIQRQRGDRPAAVARGRELATSLSDQAKAPLVHLQATLDAAQLARGGASESLERYVALLQEHIATWPSEPTADKARLWLGKLKEHQQQWAAALEAYRGVSPADEKNYLAAIDGSARCYYQLLSQLRDEGEPTAGPADRAARYYENILLGGDDRLPERFAEIDRRAALHAARLRLQFTSNGFDTAQTILEAALESSQSAHQHWKSDAHALLVVAQAGAGDRSAAARTLAQLSGGSPARQLEMLSGLREITDNSQPAVRRDLAALQLEVVDRLKQTAAQLEPGQRKALEVAEAQALASAGRRADAVNAFQRASEKYPDDGAIQTAYAEILLEADDRQTLLKARDAWRNVLRRTPPQTPAWFEAKYATALAHFKLGERRQAADIIKLLAAVHPQMGGAEMKDKFLDLLARCQ